MNDDPKLMIAVTCKGCGVTYFAELIMGGYPIGEESTDTIANAYVRGDKVELVDGDKGVVMGICKCVI